MRITKYRTLINGERTPILDKVMSTNYPYIDRLCEPGSVTGLLNGVFQLDREADEHVYMVCADSSLRHCTGVFEISHGNHNRAMCEAREIVSNALLVNAVNVFIVHNHPSGNLDPNEEDKKVYEKLNASFSMVGIEMKDFLIVSYEGYYSFQEQTVVLPVDNQKAC